MSTKRKKSGAAPARDAAGATAGTEPGLQDSPISGPSSGPSSEPAETAMPSIGREAPEEPWADPWSIGKACGLRPERVVQKCQAGAGRRDARGVWRVTAEGLASITGWGPARCRNVLDMARSWRADDENSEGAVVYALSGPGRVAVVSKAERPRSARTLAWVREPSGLRCGDEVVIRYAELGRAEVTHGR